ncbi:MAG TPA: response regulator transcription factor [Acidobacteriaceae bacterium]|nr:response regulator transcription factor [Acidobacteriaceae bacterium]
MRFTDDVIPSLISTVIFDAPGITSDLLLRAFSKQPEYRVMGCCKSSKEAIRLITQTQPDTVIISVFEREGSLAALQMLEELALIGSPARAVVLSANPTNDEVVSYFRAQARGVLSGTTADFALLCKCLTCVHAGQIWATSEQLVCLVRSLSEPKLLRVLNTRGLPVLSSREQEVLDLLAEGLSNRDIAAALAISEHTVRNHLFHIFDKLGVSSRMEAVLYAFNHSKTPSPVEKTAYPVQGISSRRRNGTLAVNG